jgi:hypothetical protein
LIYNYQTRRRHTPNERNPIFLSSNPPFPCLLPTNLIVKSTATIYHPQLFITSSNPIKQNANKCDLKCNDMCFLFLRSFILVLLQSWNWMDACKHLLLSRTDSLFHILEHRHRSVQNISARIKAPHWLTFREPGRLSRYSKSLRVRLTGDRIPVRGEGAKFSTPSRATTRPTQPLVQCVPSLSTGKAAETWCCTPTSF